MYLFIYNDILNKTKKHKLLKSHVNSIKNKWANIIEEMQN